MTSKRPKKTTRRKTARIPARKWVTVENTTIDAINKDIISSIQERENRVAEKQKEFESYERKISSRQYLHQSKQDELEVIQTKLLNLENHN